jgi:hypothetical protein
MHIKVARLQQAARFERVLEALAQELIRSTDEELLEAANDLGMDPAMRGSAAFFGLKYSAALRMSDFFEVPALGPQRLETERNSVAPLQSRKGLPGRKKRPKTPDGGGSESDSE